MNINQIVKIIEHEFFGGQLEQIASKEMIDKLEKKGYKRIDIDDALDEAERRNIVAHRSGFYKWIDPKLRKMERVKTQRRFQVLAEIFRNGKIEFQPKENLILTLKEKGFDDEEVRRILIEAERDFILRFVSRSFSPSTRLVAGCTWIPPRDRKKEAEADRHQREWFEKNLEKKAFEEERWG